VVCSVACLFSKYPIPESEVLTPKSLGQKKLTLKAPHSCSFRFPLINENFSPLFHHNDRTASLYMCLQPLIAQEDFLGTQHFAQSKQTKQWEQIQKKKI
jgi:hypothetical protein